MSTTRTEVFAAIDAERQYQDEQWGTLEQRGKQVGAWITLMQHYMNQATKEWATNRGDEKALHEIRKIAGIAVACMEQHRVPERETASSVSRLTPDVLAPSAGPAQNEPQAIHPIIQQLFSEKHIRNYVFGTKPEEWYIESISEHEMNRIVYIACTKHNLKVALITNQSEDHELGEFNWWIPLDEIVCLIDMDMTSHYGTVDECAVGFTTKGYMRCYDRFPDFSWHLVIKERYKDVEEFLYDDEDCENTYHVCLSPEKVKELLQSKVPPIAVEVLED
jgi:hypothetical protein